MNEARSRALGSGDGKGDPPQESRALSAQLGGESLYNSAHCDYRARAQHKHAVFKLEIEHHRMPRHVAKTSLMQNVALDGTMLLHLFQCDFTEAGARVMYDRVQYCTLVHHHHAGARVMYGRVQYCTLVHHHHHQHPTNTTTAAAATTTTTTTADIIILLRTSPPYRKCIWGPHH